jgi:hypothetical protein
MTLHLQGYQPAAGFSIKYRGRLPIRDLYPHHIFLTPALIKIAPGPAVTFFGNLSDTHVLVKVLGLESIADAQ